MGPCLEGHSNQYAAVTLQVKTLRPQVVSRSDFLTVTLGNRLNHHSRFLLCKNSHISSSVFVDVGPSRVDKSPTVGGAGGNLCVT